MRHLVAVLGLAFSLALASDVSAQMPPPGPPTPGTPFAIVTGAAGGTLPSQQPVWLTLPGQSSMPQAVPLAVATRPAKVQNLCVALASVPFNPGSVYCAVEVSSDGGQTWSPTPVQWELTSPFDEPHGGCSDPSAVGSYPQGTEFAVQCEAYAFGASGVVASLELGE